MSRYPGQACEFNLQNRQSFELEHEDSIASSSSNDDDYNQRRIRRYDLTRPSSSGHQQQHQASSSNQNYDSSHSVPVGTNEPIRVRLNESYFANEQRMLYNMMANARQKLTSLQMFNPAKNETIREEQQNWTESEKYTLDSINEIKTPIDGQFQWSRPEDGRLVWASKTQYFLAITSYSIGLGNVIRFPILVQKNGGLAFVIPFVIMLLVEGIPLFYLELAIGQRMRKAAISCWSLVSPFAAGIGLASGAVSFIVGLYYNTMVAYTLLYLWDATTATTTTIANNSAEASGRQLPWTKCPDDGRNLTECELAGPVQYYWYRRTLNASASVDQFGSFNWPVCLGLLCAWLLSHVCLAKGLSSSKRVVYVISTFPYVILTVFFFKAVSLDGMSDGIYYLFAPEWSKLAEPYIWMQSAAQVFFSLGLGFGGLIALSSYNPVNNNCHRDAIRVSMVNFATSIYAGVVIFAILGFKANLSNEKCLAEREHQIQYYLADYNLKMIDYGQPFEPVPGKQALRAPEDAPQEGFSLGILGQGDAIAPEVDPEAPPGEPRQPEVAKNEDNDDEDEDQNEDQNQEQDDYYSSADAIASIKSLDKQLDSTRIQDKGDEDAEFIIDASSLMSKQELERIVAQIPNLPECSVQRELEAATQGTGLVFVVMAEALGQFEDAQLWAIVFFLMLFTLGLDSQFGNLEGLLSSLADLRAPGNEVAPAISRELITGLICSLSLVISMFMFANQAGSYVFAIFDEYAASFSLVLIALFELIAISYLYGLKRFCDDCELMTGKRPSFVIMLSWRYISPILLLIVIFATMHEFATAITYETWSSEGRPEVLEWPGWCIGFGAMLILVCVIWIPLVAVMRMLKLRAWLPEEDLNQCWFPAEELREFHHIDEEHKVTKWERVLLGFSSDDY